MFFPSLQFNMDLEQKTIEIGTVDATGETKPAGLMMLDTLSHGMAEVITGAVGMAYQLGAQNMAIALDRPDLRVNEKKPTSKGSAEDALRTLLEALAGDKGEI